jgi:tripartite-type tricarboxylate transporter receptor subunit TctC
VIVENKPGAGGILGTESVARAEPDGYTLLLGAGGAITINPSIYPSLPYKPQSDFEPISQIATSSLVAVVNPALPVHSMKELQQYAAKRPDGITFASPGTGTPLHLAGEMVKSMTGMKMTHIPYKGSGPALNDLLGGRVDVMFDVMGTSLPHIKSGKLRPIGVTGLTREKLLPEVPTLDEQGLKGFDVTVWYGLFAPARTPADVVRRLEAAVVKVAAMPDVRERLNTLALTPAARGGAALARQVSQEIPRWARIVKEAGAKVE